jgi:hypothetical protein
MPINVVAVDVTVEGAGDATGPYEKRWNPNGGPKGTGLWPLARGGSGGSVFSVLFFLLL